MKCYTRLGLGLAVMGLALVGGCISDQAGSGSLAHVVLDSETPAQARAATERVFTDAGYQLVEETVSELVFEREATEKDRLLYGRYKESLIMRVVVQLEPHRLGGMLVRADAYAVHGSGWQDQKVMRVGRRPYQTLLNSVRASSVASTP